VAVNADPVGEAADAARAGALIVIPTDTVYGIGTRPDAAEATARLFAAKDRSRSLQLPVLVDSLAGSRGVAELDVGAERLAAACWPGALTMVLPRTAAARAWDLGGDPGTVGVRVPRHRLALAVLERSGPLAITSANRSGEPPATTCDDLEAAFGEAVRVYLCEDAPLNGMASTVVDLCGTRPRVLREGAITREALARLLGGKDPLLDSPLSP
jgi:tRNA threonylcarbamoyl adenosine modification protein (Sua5/YciO/YrdC/YwlC family)